jgi:hypothetical protein
MRRRLVLTFAFVSLLILSPDLASLQNESTPIPLASPTNPPFDWLFKHIRDLMATNMGCSLPCFAGLVPGESTTDDIDTALSLIDYNGAISHQMTDDDYNRFSLTFRQKGHLWVEIFTENKTLQRIRLYLGEPNLWLSQNMLDIPNVIHDLGAPDDVFMVFLGPPSQFIVVLVYNVKGVLIQYWGEFIEQDNDPDEPQQICFSRDKADIYHIDVWLQNPEANELVEQHIPDLRDASRDTRPYWPLEKVAGINPTQFAELRRDDPDHCITTLSPNELKALGYVF